MNPESLRVELPNTGFLRLSQIIGNPKARPPIPALIPVSKSTWWAGVKSGRYPPPVKLGTRITAWSIESVRALIERVAQEPISAATPLGRKQSRKAAA